MRIAIVVPPIAPGIGGAYAWIDTLLSALGDVSALSHHELVVLADEAESAKRMMGGAAIRVVEFSQTRPGSSQLGYDCQRLRWAGERVRFAACARVPGLRGKLTYPIHPRDDVARRFSNALEAERIEFVWFPSATWTPTDCPFVATVWDLQHRLQPVFPEVGSIASWEGREKLFSRYLGRAAVVLAGSERCKEEVSLFYQVPSERIEVIPYPTSRFALATRSSEPSDDRVAQLNVKKPYFLYPAQLWPHKNHVNLLLALDLLGRQRDFRPHLVLVGSDQGNGAYVRQWVDRLGLAEQVHLLGFVPQETLAALYGEALALAFVSFFGPDNLPPLEAFALGCPVIASDLPGARDQYGDAAAYVDPADVEGIAAAMATMYESPETRAQYTARGACRAEALTATNYLERVFRVFDRLEAVRRSWGERW